MERTIRALNLDNVEESSTSSRLRWLGLRNCHFLRVRVCGPHVPHYDNTSICRNKFEGNYHVALKEDRSEYFEDYDANMDLPNDY